MGNKTSKDSLYFAIEISNEDNIKMILGVINLFFNKSYCNFYNEVHPEYLNQPMTKDGKTTPLSRAAWRGSESIIKLLVEVIYFFFFMFILFYFSLVLMLI